MKKFSLKGMVNGWFIGQFSPSVFSSKEVEVAVKRYKKGDSETMHYHRLATEITVIVSGSVEMNGIKYFRDDILLIEPFESTDFFAVEDTITTVVKTSGALQDKYEGRYFD